MYTQMLYMFPIFYDFIMQINSNLGTICNNFKSYEELAKDTNILITGNGIITFTIIFGSYAYSGYTFIVNSFAMFADANLDVATQNRQVTRSFRVFTGDTIQLQVNPNTTLNSFRIYYTGKSEQRNVFLFIYKLQIFLY